ncbi:FGGY-family carbohydrate kinase [Thiohalorhabdus sp.]|uniref:FGGY-family carbohydrate kinase n=1 Tax=Thiohalorhabdus sp. TaxID=3094134 RepID=UPI002FC3AC10
MARPSEAVFIGVDVGTRGVRACALDRNAVVVDQTERSLAPPRGDGGVSEQDPETWWQGLVGAARELAGRIGSQSVTALAVDSTSGTLVVTAVNGQPLRPALLYNDRRATAAAEAIARVAPAASGAHGASSSLAKLRHLGERGELTGAGHALHATDWLTGRLIGKQGVTDENNALKMGYDPVQRDWPDWLGKMVPVELLPEVVEPGSRLGKLEPRAAAELGLPAGVGVHAGTTDSIAAFLATGTERRGEAVTSLGSTLALKVISESPVFAPEHGVYSHRLGQRWLPGGASNSGGAVLLQYFTPNELTALTPYLDPETPTGLDYLPLPAIGERFPDNDPHLAPRIEPIPADRAAFLQGLLEGIAAIEARGYRRLAEVGAEYPERVHTAGGGAGNPAWTRIREQQLGVPVASAGSAEAACGAARLAMGPVT